MSRARDIADFGSVSARLDTVSNSEGALSNRNFITNGEMQCWQRATSATAANNTYNTVDRFKAYNNIGAYTTERSTDNPNGSGYSLKCQCTTANGSVAASSYAFINHEIEGQNLQHLAYGTSNAKNVTLSFWVKSSKTGIYTVGVYKHAGGGTAYMYRKEYTISAANTWEKKTITISPTAGSTSFITASAGAIQNNNSYGFGVSFNLSMGSNYQGTNDTWENNAKYATSNQVNWMDNTSNNFYITQIQMEVGSQSTDFEHRTYADELARCQRYYQFYGKEASKILVGGDASGSGDFYNGWMVYPVVFRSNPTFTKNGTWQTSNCAQPNGLFGNAQGITLYAAAAGAGAWYFHTNGTDDYLEMDAEL
tara:strand:- start:214 stop:1311 length:1098 start_codon:yes stop_codon:yes gene_type:complete